MAKREVLKRDGGGTGHEGAQEGPETDRENHRGSRHEAWHLSRDALPNQEAVRTVQA